MDLHYYREMKHARMFLLYVFLLGLTCQKVGLPTTNLGWTGYQALLLHRISGIFWVLQRISENPFIWPYYPVLHRLYLTEYTEGGYLAQVFYNRPAGYGLSG